MIYKYGKRSRFEGVFISISVQFSTILRSFNKTIIPLALVGYEMYLSLSSHIQRALVK